MLQQALNRHSQIVIPPETAYFTHFLGHSRRGQHQHLRRINADLEIDLDPPIRRISRPDEAVAFFERIAESYVKRIGRENVALFGEKTPHHILRADRIVRLFPDSKIVLIYRDGRDVALSLTKVPWYSPDLWLGFDNWLRSYKWHRWLVDHAPENVIQVRYEDLVSEPTAELSRVAESLGIEYESQMAEGEGNEPGVPEWESGWKSRALERIAPSRIGNWRRELTLEQIRPLERWGREALTSLGYELATDAGKPLPLTYLPRRYWKRFAWRVRNGWRLVLKNVFGR